MNKIILIGRVTKNIELKFTQSGTEVADFSLAVTRNFKNPDGEYDADFINCIVFGKLANTISNYVRKGDRLAVEGRIQVRNYQNSEGRNVYVTEVVVSNVDFIEAKKSEPKEEVPRNEGIDPFANNEVQLEISDDDLPFYEV